MSRELALAIAHAGEVGWLERRDAACRAEGYLVRRTLMSYVDVHFGSNHELPRVFVAECAATRE